MTQLYKIHGCISQDVAFGDHSRMILTEADYDEYEQYRQSLFNSLRAGMFAADTLIIGQSLKDAHLRDLAKYVAGLREQGVSSKVYLMSYEDDPDRAQLLERRGILVFHATLDELMHKLSLAGLESRESSIYTTQTPSASRLKPSLAATTTDVSHALSLGADATRLYNGAPASYGDIRRGYTINRWLEVRLREIQESSRGIFTILAGAGGVGKTSLARALLLRKIDEGHLCWEHQNSFPLDWQGWLEVEAQLRAEDKVGYLMIDDCANHLSLVNRLADALGRLESPALRLLLTVNFGQWKTRAKSSYFFTRGSVEHLQLLTEADIDELVNLLDRQPDIRSLVEEGFLQLGRQEKIQRLRDRCSADMFVCLKNIFHSERLDNILLQEYAGLDVASQDVYRHVAAIQAMGGKVHRQLILRLLSVEAGALESMLVQMADVVSEYDIKPHEGIYGWATRHDVIAHVIATYKFADQNELYGLLSRIIEGLNPTHYLERETARAMASDDMGIARLSSHEEQVTLLSRLIKVVPAERTPRRRLVKLFLQRGELILADQAIAASQREIGKDNIIDRYRAISAMQRAENTEGLLDEDRVAMLLEAERIALQCVKDKVDDRYNYRILADIGAALMWRSGNDRALVNAIDLFRQAEDAMADPDFNRERRSWEVRLNRLRIDVADVSVANVSVNGVDEGALTDSGSW
ncbi:SIR2 family protein [Amycolatopsis sp. NPDC052450]|uniref:SIR2 family protein n=1 Tax=Amycolatopsis sp. NPDC052450 TaxID=3363937 RepID=UPI0037C5CBDC